MIRRLIGTPKQVYFEEAGQLIDEYTVICSDARIQTKTRLTPLKKRRQAV